jgi:anti-anti-sigma factor
MEIEVSGKPDVQILTLSGRFDTPGAQQFDDNTRQMDTAARYWILDLARVDYMSSSGARSILTLEKNLRKRSGRLILANLTPFVRQLLEMMCLITKLWVAHSVDDALDMTSDSSDE